MFKNTRGFLFAALAALALSACGGGSVGEGDGNTGEPGDEVTGIEITLGASEAEPGQSDILVRATLEGGSGAVSGKVINFSSTGGATFTSGTRTTNAAGIADSRLTVPTQAGQITVTVRGEGFLTSGTILVVPGAPRNIDVEPLPNKVPLGGTSRVQAIVTDAFGNPISGATMRFAVATNNTGGRFPTSSQAISDEDGATRIDYTAGTTPGTDELRVTVAGATPGTATVNASASNAAPGVVQLTMERVNLQAGGSTTSATAFVADENGQPIQGVLVGFSATGGSILEAGSTNPTNSATTNASGRAVVKYQPPPTGGTFVVRAEIGAFSSEQTVVVTQSPQTVTSVDLQLSSNDLSSNAQTSTNGVTITAIVLDADNKIIAGQPVSFSSNSGILTPQGSGSTDVSGQARAVLTVGTNPRNRPILVTVKAGEVTRTVTVNVVGTRFSTIEGPSALRAGAVDGNIYTVRLQDADSNGIAGQQVRFLAFENSSTTAVTLGTVTTQSNPRGEASIAVSPRAGLTQLRLVAELVTQAGEVPLRSSEFSIAVNNRTLSFNEDSSNGGVSLERIPINPNGANLDQRVVVSLRQAAAGGTTTPVASAQIRLSATRGAVIVCDSNPAVQDDLETTNANGLATFCVRGSNTGPVTLSAVTVNDGLTISRQTNFVSTIPKSIELQASPATIGTNANSEIRATVKDAAGNRVVGQTVNFSIVTDPTNGSLSSTTAVTNDVGIASVTYRSSSVASARDGIRLRASIVSPAGVAPAEATLTVGNQALRISLGTSNVVGKDASTRYKLPYLATVKDSAGNPVPDAEFSVNIRPLFYRKGQKIFLDPVWVVESSAMTCRAEDTDGDGEDDDGEDVNGNDILDPSDGATVPRDLELRQSDASVEFDVTYPRDRSGWVVVELSATARVSGSQAIEKAIFTLPAAAEDVNKEDISPPGVVSPFGVVRDCTVADTGAYAKITTTTQQVESGDVVTVSVNLEGTANKQVTIPLFATVASGDVNFISVEPQPEAGETVGDNTIEIAPGSLTGEKRYVFENTATGGRIIPVTISIGKPVNAELGSPSSVILNVRP